MEQEICRIIEKVLELEVDEVSIADSMETIDKWDSLGLLSILTALEEKFGNKVAAIEDLSLVKSVKDIVRILKRESII